MRRRLAFLALAIALLVMPGVASAQFFSTVTEPDPDAKMLLEADTLVYNVRTKKVTALGNVYIHYRGYQLFASEVSYDETSKRLSASRGVRLEEPEGNVIIARDLELNEDLSRGFANGLRADTIYRTRLAANRAERVSEDVTIFEEAGYTACWSCRKRPDQPPSWAIKARRVVHNDSEHTLRFEEPRFDAFGSTVAVLPSFTIPDPTVKRKSGFLTPTAVYSNLLGFGVRAPYFQTLGPSADVTMALTPLSRQGLFSDIEYRQRTASGSFGVRASGIYQLDPDAFDGSSGDRLFRGAISTQGNFYLNPMWQWGWESTVSTDRRYLSDYKQSTGDNLTAPTNIYLKGLGERNYFEASFWAFRILQDDYVSNEVLNPPSPFTGVGQRLQGKQAYVHPAIDYDGVVDRAVFGGELSYKFNVISLSRQETDAFGALVDGVDTARFRGVEGTYTRASAEVAWRRRLFAPLGQVLTPSAGIRGDLYAINNRDPNVTQLDDGFAGRVMPYVGISYRWPWLISARWGTQTIEPIAEIYARPNETHIGSLPNDDAQSVVFDDTNLFGPTRFSGYDRVEGGVRSNIGLRYTLQTYSGAFLSTTFGQSYHLAGRNSYRVPDILDSTGNSGLTSDRSDFVGAVYLDTNQGLAMSAKGRFDDEDFDLQRAELSASARAGPLSSRVVYAFLAKQPDLGVVDDREEIHGSASLQVLKRVRVFGQMRYDLQDRDIIRTGVGLAYDDDALSMSLAFSEDRGGLPEDPVDRTVYFRIGLRTIGDASTSTSLDN
ncbi:LPS-assembly protein LptD [Acuticoccus mangrovi]|uniref:LPS-assembly protein LptD n=1 Tax=Acuticoccus mangrovi TaxID=2796142 RepID=A0A934IKJ6_9HYPH|nr:LPS assembly protein LptD [Acuticoccus mangrovi]MBJ3776671.1 LPS-assembly protein LptD [Acuticoccus mangrovi]